MGNEIAECQDNKTSDMPYVGISIRSLNVEEGMENRHNGRIDEFGPNQALQGEAQ